MDNEPIIVLARHNKRRLKSIVRRLKLLEIQSKGIVEMLEKELQQAKDSFSKPIDRTFGLSFFEDYLYE